MTFDETLARVLELLQRDGRVSYRTLRRRFDLDEEYLEDLKAEIIQAKKLAIDEDGVVLVWRGDTTPSPVPMPAQERVPLVYTRASAFSNGESFPLQCLGNFATWSPLHRQKDSSWVCVCPPRFMNILPC